MKDRRFVRAACFAAAVLVAVPGLSLAQVAPAPPATAVSPAADAPTFSQQQLDQLLAPIALYPDALLSQVLMASTYPIEVVQADRWVKANPTVNGDALADALEQQTWDPSVKSLVNVPQVLAMMSEKLDWTTQLGDAFIAQEAQVSDTIQALRAKAQQAGSLKSTGEQQVVVDDQGGPAQIEIVQTNPSVIYVPVYDPTIVYGTWWYPDYPPYYYYPPHYVHSRGIWFGNGITFGVAWGYAWGAWDWRRHDVNININLNSSYNRHIDRDRYRKVYEHHDRDFHGNTGAWEHDPSHRRGVA
jgi:hypothetical protein